MPRDFSTISQCGVNSCAMNNVISPEPHKTWRESTRDETRGTAALDTDTPTRLCASWQGWRFAKLHGLARYTRTRFMVGLLSPADAQPA